MGGYEIRPYNLLLLRRGATFVTIITGDLPFLGSLLMPCHSGSNNKAHRFIYWPI